MNNQSRAEETDIPIVNCRITGTYVNALKYPDGSIKHAVCKFSTTKEKTDINAEKNICRNSHCRNHERL